MKKAYVGIILLLFLVVAGMAYATATQSSAHETDASLAVGHYGGIVGNDCTLDAVVENKENKSVGINLLFNGVEWNSAAQAGHRAFGSVNVPYYMQGNEYIGVAVTGTIGSKAIQENYKVLCASSAGGSGGSSGGGTGNGKSGSSSSNIVSSAPPAPPASGNAITTVARLLRWHGHEDEDEDD